MIDDLEERIRREARFASDVSHDLRGPLTALSAAVSVVNRRRGQLPPEASQAIDLLDEQVASFNGLVVDLLEISRFEAGTATLQPREVPAVEFVRAVLAERGATLPVTVDGDADVRIAVDPRRMHQVLTNLIDNAEHYAGGPSAIVIGPAPTSSRVRIHVDDDGPGIDPGERQSIFDRFHRGQAGSSTDAPRGSGLGLALAADHVALHGGSLWVEDAPGGGARFTIELPIAEAANGDPVS
jgi:signal transduction histidine kinase